jgi:hypothetical protein
VVLPVPPLPDVTEITVPNLIPPYGNNDAHAFRNAHVTAEQPSDNDIAHTNYYNQISKVLQEKIYLFSKKFSISHSSSSL